MNDCSGAFRLNATNANTNTSDTSIALLDHFGLFASFASLEQKDDALARSFFEPIFLNPLFPHRLSPTPPLFFSLSL